MKTIKRILVPVDFSQNSTAAFQYALDLCEKLNKKAASTQQALIKVIHVCETIGAEPSNGILHNSPVLEKDMREFVEQNIIEDGDGAVITRRKVNIETDIYYGSPSARIVKLADEGFDLIVMGMVGEKTFNEIIFGSVATHVAQNAHCPVLLVPEGKHFTKIQNLAYACDFDHKSFKHPALVADVAQLFNAHVHLVFVKTFDKTKKDYSTDLADMKVVFAKQAPTLKFNGYIIEEDDVFYGINNFSKEHNIDMIVMITKNYKFWERLFHPSVTKELAMYSELPLLVIKAVD
jgi:nucleotide-binding universal stress UspA family protein